jgi:signal transduction histidine kinase
MPTPADVLDAAICEATTDPLVYINHELRTPLNAILGFSELLAEAPALDERHRRYATHIRTSGHRLLCLVDQVLRMAREAADAGVPVGPALVDTAP